MARAILKLARDHKQLHHSPRQRRSAMAKRAPAPEKVDRRPVVYWRASCRLC